MATLKDQELKELIRQMENPLIALEDNGHHRISLAKKYGAKKLKGYVDKPY